MAIIPKNRYTNHLLNSINPYIRLAYYDTMNPPQEIKPRNIYDYEILYIKSCKPTITIDSTQYNAQSGDFFFFKPRQKHSIVLNNTTLVQPHIHFDLIYQEDSSAIPVSYKPEEAMTPQELAYIRPDITDQLFSPFPSYVRLTNPLYVEQHLFDVITAYYTPELYPEIQVKWRFLRLLDQILCEITWMRSEHKNLKNERARQIKLYLEHHADQPISMSDLAEVYHLAASNISRIFKKTYGVSPIRFHQLNRIKRAKEMIHYTNLSLTDIAYQFGFTSVQDFSRAFQRIEGVPPSHLRQPQEK